MEHHYILGATPSLPAIGKSTQEQVRRGDCVKHLDRTPVAADSTKTLLDMDRKIYKREVQGFEETVERGDNVFYCEGGGTTLSCAHSERRERRAALEGNQH